MTVTTIEKLSQHVGQVVTLQGWVYDRTSKGKLHFVLLRDGSGIVQCVVFRGNVGEDFFNQVAGAGQESSITLTGLVKAEPRAPGGFEIDVQSGRVLQAVQGYPITPKEHGIEYLMEHRHLWLRSKRPWAVMRIRHAVIMGIRNFFDERGFTCMDAPIFTPNACEGTSTLFEVPYFEQMAYLTQSGQLYAEAAAMALGKVYTFGPTFRAEKSKTRRHLTEFWMIEPEMAYATLDDVMSLAEDMLSYVVAHVLKTRRAELAVLERDVTKLEKIVPPFPRLTYEEASRILLDSPEIKGTDLAFQPGEDFGAPHETIISNLFDRPVMVHRYPAAIKAFYMKRDPLTRPSACRSTCSAPRVSARSSAAASVKTSCSCCSTASNTRSSRRRLSSGTSTCAATARCRTAASGSASSAPWRGSAASSTCARRSRSRARSTASLRERRGVVGVVPRLRRAAQAHFETQAERRQRITQRPQERSHHLVGRFDALELEHEATRARARILTLQLAVEREAQVGVDLVLQLDQALVAAVPGPVLLHHEAQRPVGVARGQIDHLSVVDAVFGEHGRASVAAAQRAERSSAYTRRPAPSESHSRPCEARAEGASKAM
jgi:asparaginyl-tRNA synthetase